jgi:hypothetical protein
MSLRVAVVAAVFEVAAPLDAVALLEGIAPLEAAASLVVGYFVKSTFAENLKDVRMSSNLRSAEETTPTSVSECSDEFSFVTKAGCVKRNMATVEVMKVLLCNRLNRTRGALT